MEPYMSDEAKRRLSETRKDDKEMAAIEPETPNARYPKPRPEVTLDTEALDEGLARFKENIDTIVSRWPKSLMRDPKARLGYEVRVANPPLMEVRTTSSTGGQKGTKLERFDLIPVEPLSALARLYGKGARKYADRNWEKGYEWSKSYAALQRHANLFWGGYDFDECDDQCADDCVTHTWEHHLTAVIFHAMALLEFERTHPEFDDRVAPERN